MRRWLRYAFFGVLVGSLLLLGCVPGQEEEGAAGADAAEWAWLQQAKQNLDAKRQELAELRQQLADEPEEAEAPDQPAAEPEGETPEGGAEAPDLESRIAQLESEIASLSEEYGGRLVLYINSLGIPRGEPMSPEQQAAMRMKSDYDIELAKEWIEKGGDYKRAIEIYESQLPWDPDYERLHQELEWANSMRFMTEERFDQVTKGMTEEEVRGVLGPVNLRNIREYPEQDVRAWFYLRGDGGAAGVWFEPDKRSGEYEVYQVKFDAVKPPSEREGDEEISAEG